MVFPLESKNAVLVFRELTRQTGADAFAKQREGSNVGRLWDQRSENVVLFQVSQLSRATPCFPQWILPAPSEPPIPRCSDAVRSDRGILKSLGLAANKIFIPPKNNASVDTRHSEREPTNISSGLIQISRENGAPLFCPLLFSFLSLSLSLSLSLCYSIRASCR